MILVDANLLIYATDPRSDRHESALSWLDGQLSGTSRVGLPWESMLAFTRIVTNPRIYERPRPITLAWRQVEAWLDCQSVWVPVAGPSHRTILTGLLGRLGGGSKLLPDAHLAALAIEHGLMLCTCDGDFARFEGLRWMNPLVSP